MKKILHILILSQVFILGQSTSLSAQNVGGSPISLHINCHRCDMDYIRQEIGYLQHVRDQGLADVQAFINRIQSGNGGNVYELSFTGKNEFEGLAQELVFETNPNQTRDEIREGLLKRIEAGLLPYLLKAGLDEEIDIKVNHSLQAEGETVVEKKDPWNYWIFEIRGEGDFEKESRRERFSIEAGFEADHVTEEWKIRGGIEFDLSESRFESDEETFVSTRRSTNFDLSAVKSLSNHWSTGAFGGINYSSYRNLDISYNIAPAIEYTFFPYKEAIRREISLAYGVMFEHNKYIEETIYGKTSESLAKQILILRTRFRQPWGSVFASLEASNYLHDFSKNRVVLDGFANIRLFQGFSLRFSTEIQLIRDLLTLPAGESSLEDILLRQRQIATDFTTEFGIGISYTFGSAFNSIVNPRMNL